MSANEQILHKNPAAMPGQREGASASQKEGVCFPVLQIDSILFACVTPNIFQERMMEERRRYERISMDDNSGYYDYTIEIDGACFLAMLMDISIGGARLKLNDAPGINTCGRKGTITNEYYAKPYLAGKNYMVAWQNEYYIGVSFTEPLIGSYKPPYFHEPKSS